VEKAMRWAMPRRVVVVLLDGFPCALQGFRTAFSGRIDADSESVLGF
jgi:hypothetical protein